MPQEIAVKEVGGDAAGNVLGFRPFLEARDKWFVEEPTEMIEDIRKVKMRNDEIMDIEEEKCGQEAKKERNDAESGGTKRQGMSTEATEE